MKFTKSNWTTFDEGIKKEWFLSNGIGGFACSTLIGANTRRYHALLVSSLNPPTNRVVALSKLDESITIGKDTYNIYSHQAQAHTMEGFRYLEDVTIDPLPTFCYKVKDTVINKKICMKYGENTVAILYSINNGNYEASIRIAPLVNFRDHHFNTAKAQIKFDCNIEGRTIGIKPDWWNGAIKINCSKGAYKSLPDCWFMGMYYAVEAERGLHAVEDHFIPGYYEINMLPFENICFSVVCTTEEEPYSTDADELIRLEEERIKNVVAAAGYDDDFANALVIAADKHIVYRKSTNSLSIIAGYPWFTDWGRDAMIALPGLTLATGRIKDAEVILSTFVKYEKDGLIPNVFPDGGTEPAYNTVDAALWLFEAIYKYIKCGGNIEFIKQNIYQHLRNIINSYIRGTKHSIRMDRDVLITAGNVDTQLTWMDAKVGNWTVTPRQGKAVEINALWYNALMIMSYIAQYAGDGAEQYRMIADAVEQSFNNVFWNDEKQCLFDVVDDNFNDYKIRPNQIFAVSLSFPVIKGERAQKVVKTVMDELYTPLGLRSLARSDADYIGIYKGNQFERDGAYHQGTVWAWLTGHFIKAYMRVNNYSLESFEKAQQFIEPFRMHINDAGIGTISEIFDGNQPHVPRGCFSQAWSIAEILRIYVEYIMPRQQCNIS